MANIYNVEFKEALREIAQRVSHFDSPTGIKYTKCNNRLFYDSFLVL